jgi:hypothetical protein
MKKIILNILIILVFFLSCKKEPSKIETAESLITPVDFLSDNKFRSLTIELIYDQGYPPSSQTINNLKYFLFVRLHKPDGIQISTKEKSGGGQNNLSLADVSEIERKNRTYYSKESALTCFIYLANSEYSENTGSNKTLGITYSATSVVLFGKTITNLSGGIGQPPYSVLETTVTEHEFGHLMGLVNKGTGMVRSHIDATHGKHCNNSECLTYYLVETSDIVSNLSGGSIPVLDSNCIKDLQRNGGK